MHGRDLPFHDEWLDKLLRVMPKQQSSKQSSLWQNKDKRFHKCRLQLRWRTEKQRARWCLGKCTNTTMCLKIDRKRRKAAPQMRLVAKCSRSLLEYRWCNLSSRWICLMKQSNGILRNGCYTATSYCWVSYWSQAQKELIDFQRIRMKT